VVFSLGLSPLRLGLYMDVSYCNLRIKVRKALNWETGPYHGRYFHGIVGKLKFQSIKFHGNNKAQSKCHTSCLKEVSNCRFMKAAPERAVSLMDVVKSNPTLLF
jgi:hypothetical protein